ncbi:GNAT family N-acetyltransferase [Streptomyces sp. NRRL B-1677]|uniref:GNAT family N-acetyltransferase n=2 Tax=Streptomyces TaxID=1883 RepID=A0A3B0BCP6_9ACTN|nr:GNAT family N-acetyltransferase [Streptomyces klenkii]MBF6044068.1 GNAT family N-acetyltransferase [Streptomyces sp. NRRL B-1677]RKN70530.1 GNAT family N-acetyltransferase [Streptomyces klenkii]
MEHIIRPVRADDWEKSKELRLVALSDPAAPIAFLDTYEKASAQPDSYWQERARGSSEALSVITFVAEAPDGTWDGSLTVLVELPDADEDTVFGGAPSVPQTHIVGVFVRPEARGNGLIQALFSAAVAWSWELSEPAVERIRLFVHEDNGRALSVYRKAGFVPSGLTVAMPDDPLAKEYELELVRPAG